MRPRVTVTESRLAVGLLFDCRTHSIEGKVRRTFLVFDCRTLASL